MMHKLLSAIGTIAMFTSLISPLSASAATTVPLASLASGDLIRGISNQGVYYYGQDGFRYVFPNDKTYFTWYTNFNSVKWISDSDLSSIQIGGNVTYKPGVKMVKIVSSDKTYAVGAHGTLRHITTEPIAIALYGSNWNKQVDDIADAFFGNYKMGSAIELASSFTVNAEKSDATNIDVDKQLQTPTQISISGNTYSRTSVTISAGTAIKWTNNDSVNHTASDDAGKWGTGTLTAGQNFSRYFKTPGTYTYHCNYHPSMTGTIIVQ